MEIFQTIWTALTTENERLISILSIPFTFIEITIAMLLFLTILNINSSFKQKLYYVIFSSLFSLISRALIPDPYGIIVNLLFLIFIIMKIFKDTSVTPRLFILVSIEGQMAPEITATW